MYDEEIPYNNKKVTKASILKKHLSKIQSENVIEENDDLIDMVVKQQVGAVKDILSKDFPFIPFKHSCIDERYIRVFLVEKAIANTGCLLFCPYCGRVMPRG